jgi:hypothetical protein
VVERVLFSPSGAPGESRTPTETPNTPEPPAPENSLGIGSPRNSTNGLHQKKAPAEADALLHPSAPSKK